MSKTPRRLIRARRFFTANPHRPYVEAILCEVDTIRAIGDYKTLRRQVKHSEIVDYRQWYGYPGFVDAHAHLWALAESFQKISLHTATNASEIIRALNNDTNTLRKWGYGFSPRIIPDPDGFQALLDNEIPHVPVLIETVDAHAIWLNQRAAEELGVPCRSVLWFCDQHAEPIIKKWRSHFSIRREDMLRASRECLRHGITTVAEAALRNDQLPLWESIVQNPLLIDIAAAYAPSCPDEPLPPPIRTPRTRLHALKLFFDGALNSGGLWNSVPIGKISPQDAPPFPMDFYEAYIQQAVLRKWDVWIHAIGDLAVQAALDVFDRMPVAGVRRIEHIQFVQKEDINRFQKLNVIPSVQPYHRVLDTPLMQGVELPPTIVAYGYGLLARHVRHIILGSDFPIVPVSPLWQLKAATDPAAPSASRLPVLQSIEAFTRYAAASLGFSDRGMLWPGMLADVVFFDVPLEEIIPDPTHTCPVKVWKRGRDVIY